MRAGTDIGTSTGTSTGTGTGTGTGTEPQPRSPFLQPPTPNRNPQAHITDQPCRTAR